MVGFFFGYQLNKFDQKIAIEDATLYTIKRLQTVAIPFASHPLIVL